jgi:hypothetical protein
MLCEIPGPAGEKALTAIGIAAGHLLRTCMAIRDGIPILERVT